MVTLALEREVTLILIVREDFLLLRQPLVECWTLEALTQLDQMVQADQVEFLTQLIIYRKDSKSPTDRCKSTSIILLLWTDLKLPKLISRIGDPWLLLTKFCLTKVHTTTHQLLRVSRLQSAATEGQEISKNIVPLMCIAETNSYSSLQMDLIKILFTMRTGLQLSELQMYQQLQCLWVSKVDPHQQTNNLREQALD